MPASPQPSRPPARLPAAPSPYYVPVPRRLLESLRDTPLAIGVYALIARVFRATRAPVPLSPADIAAYDPAASPAAAFRALGRLLALGYLAKAPSGGRRNAYLPAWGPIGGGVRPWDLAAPILGRPPHVLIARLPQDLLDCYLGRLEPHALRGAHVARYTTAPLLTLADVGRYALALAGYPAASAALTRLGLLDGGQALPPMPTEATLALATQRRLFDAESPIALTPAGWARLGLTPPPATPAGTPLVFVPIDGLGDPHGPPIAPPIAPPAPDDRRSTASRRPRGRFAPPPAGSHGVPCAEGSKDSTPQPPHGPQRPAGGGSSASCGRAPASRTERAAPAEEQDLLGGVAGRLHALGVRRDVAESLGQRPPALVERVIAEARAKPGVRDLAGWVVAALRALPAEAPAAPPKVSDLAILTHPGLGNAERVRWLTRFRSADPIDRPAVLARFLEEHPTG